MANLTPDAPKRHYAAEPLHSSSSQELLPPPSAGPSSHHVHGALIQQPHRRGANSSVSSTQSPYTTWTAPRKTPSLAPSISDQFALASDPSSWSTELQSNCDDPDDFLHTPDPRRDRKHDSGGTIFTARGMANLGCLLVLCLGLLILFVGYPLISHFKKKQLSNQGGFNIGGTNASGQVPEINGNWGLIDKDTPKEARTKKPYTASGPDWRLVFSDEFNTDGRTFYAGDDPYWEAVDMHYWGTNNMEWYDPAASITKDGMLRITLSEMKTHGMDYQGGLISTWNKFCFTGGLIETAVILPGANNIVGLWPAVWTMGNLGRAGYGASLEGMWPYTYDSCDVGTVANQSMNGLPLAATVNGDPGQKGVLSFLPGQKLSRCTCTGESHPGPIHADGTYVGRAAPEIDIIEAQITGQPLTGQVSQSGQYAPFNAAYEWFNTTDNMQIYNESMTFLNSYKGGVYQQAASGVTETNPDCYELGTGCASVYGFEYKPGFDDAYITWVSDGAKAWTLNVEGFAPDPLVEIGTRPVPQEPLYIIANLGMSRNFGDVDLEHLTFPATMSIDWIRVYQPSNAINIGCDPDDFPTAAYIETYLEAYSNANLTTWRDDYKQPFPKNSWLGQC